jgi:hypothetical protein
MKTIGNLASGFVAIPKKFQNLPAGRIVQGFEKKVHDDKRWRLMVGS